MRAAAAVAAAVKHKQPTYGITLVVLAALALTAETVHRVASLFIIACLKCFLLPVQSMTRTAKSFQTNTEGGWLFNGG